MKLFVRIILFGILLLIFCSALHLYAQTASTGVSFNGGATFEAPSDLPGVYAWWSADEPRNTIDKSSPSNTVSLLFDKSGNGHHLSQGAKPNQPTFLLNMVNGLPTLGFDGSRRLLGTDGITNLVSGDDVMYSIGRVIYANASANEVDLGWGNVTNAAGQFILFRPNIAAGANNVFRNVRSDDTGTAANGNLNGSTNGFYMIQLYSFSGTAFQSHMLYPSTNVFSSAAQNVGPTTVNTFAIGSYSRNGAFASGFNGQIVEEIISTNVWTTNQNNTLVRVWSQKYGITFP